MTVFQAADTPLTKQENRECLLADDSITHHLLDQAQLHSESQVTFPTTSLHTPPATPIFPGSFLKAEDTQRGSLMH